jgi:hypothetical protein
MRFILSLIVLAVTLSVEVPAAFCDDQIEWEVKQPFRFFKYRSDFEIHRWALEFLKVQKPSVEPSVLDIEHVLSDPDWWSKPLPISVTKRFRIAPTTTAKDLLTALRADEIKNENRPPGYLELERNLGRFSREYDFTRLGWASLLFPAHQQQKPLTSAQESALVDAKNVAVCWNQKEQQHNNCPDYISPKTHVLVLHLKSAENGKTPPADCTWRLDADSGAIFVVPKTGTTATTPCDQDVEIDVPATNKATVSVETAGQPVDSTTVQVRDLLVVGLGDSFSAGEGNPDVPAKMKWTTSVAQDPLVQYPRDASASEPSYVPLRKADGRYFAAQWIDRACHRSAYSYQMRAALQLALKNPQRAVTFLGYACSGAEINEGLFNPFMGPETVPDKGHLKPYRRAQLSLLLSELCIDGHYDGSAVHSTFLSPRQEDELIKSGHYILSKSGGAAADSAYRCTSSPLGQGFKRPIDIFFISIGGNDAGFAKWIAAAISPRWLWHAANAYLPILASDKAACKADRGSCDSMTPQWKRVPARYALLRDFLDNRLPFSSQSHKPILVYAYPISARDQSGADCHSGNSGMTVWAFKGICLQKNLLAGGTLPYIEYFAKTQLGRLVSEFASASSNPYTLVNEYVDEFSNHGFCATTAPNEPVDHCYSFSELGHLVVARKFPDYQNNPKKADETLHIPRRSGEDWLPFDPVLGFYPYRTRTRWARTQNDVYILINQNESAMAAQTEQVLLSFRQSAVFGSFHPTAEAHARVASSFADAAEKMLTSP